MRATNRSDFLKMYLLLLLFIMISLTAGARLAQASEYKDINSNNADFNYIQYLSGKGIIMGYPDGSFRPQEGLTRAQAAVVMVKTGQLKLDPNANSPFKDLSNDHWSRAYVAAAFKAGYINGYPDGSFKPDQQLSRAQGISLLLKLSQQPQTATLPALKDIDNQHWAAKAVAVGLASGMVGLSSDGQNYLPEAAFTRINMAHALGILLTEDPTLSASNLPGKLKVVQGKTTIMKAGSLREEEIKTETTVNFGDSIITAQGASAELSYPDGSSMLIKEDSKISIKEAQGRKYIKTNGQEGIAIDWLNLDMKMGTMFTALATKHESTESTAATQDKKTGSINKKTVASLNRIETIAVAASGSDQELPWYEASKTKKVKVKVDMPWGVAAVRGTFVMISVAPSGQANVSCLTGSAEVTNGGQTVPLGQNQSTQVTTQTAPPPPPASMPPAVVQQFAQVQNWIQQTAQIMDQNQEQAPPAPPIAAPISVQPMAAPTQSTPVQTQTQSLTSAGTASQAVSNALSSIGVSNSNTTIPPSTTTTQSGSSGSSGGGSTPIVYSTACDVSAVIVPTAASISGTDIIAEASYTSTTVVVDVTASTNASWKLYSDLACLQEISNKTMQLNVGGNITYIKVTAQDGITSKTYTKSSSINSNGPQ